MPEDPNAELSRQSYWDKRYDTTSNQENGSAAAAENFDWLRDFETIKVFLVKYLPGPGKAGKETEPRILHAGNGNSVSG